MVYKSASPKYVLYHHDVNSTQLPHFFQGSGLRYRPRYFRLLGVGTCIKAGKVWVALVAARKREVAWHVCSETSNTTRQRRLEMLLHCMAMARLEKIPRPLHVVDLFAFRLWALARCNPAQIGSRGGGLGQDLGASGSWDGSFGDPARSPPSLKRRGPEMPDEPPRTSSLDLTSRSLTPLSLTQAFRPDLKLELSSFEGQGLTAPHMRL